MSRFYIENGEILDCGFFLGSEEQYVDIMNKQDQRIAELEKQLDQLKQENETLFLQLSKQEIDEHKPVYCTLAGNDCKYLGKIKELKQQLAEKDKEIAHLKEKDNYHLRYELAGADETITNLKQQLEEKDKEIERLKERLSVFDNFKDNYGYTNYDDSEILEDLQSRAFQAEDDTQVVDELLQFFNIFDENELVDKVKEPQTQLAIQELEKVKEWLEPKYFDYEQINYLTRIIDNQIKKIKGE